jgi:hypothetical protein
MSLRFKRISGTTKRAFDTCRPQIKHYTRVYTKSSHNMEINEEEDMKSFLPSQLYA